MVGGEPQMMVAALQVAVLGKVPHFPARLDEAHDASREGPEDELGVRLHLPRAEWSM